MPYELRQLSAKHHQVIDLILDGWRQIDIVRELGLSTRAIRYVKRSTVLEHEYALRRARRVQNLEDIAYVRHVDARDKIEQEAQRAANTLIAQLDSPDERVAQRAATLILKQAFAFQGDVRYSPKTGRAVKVDSSPH